MDIKKAKESLRCGKTIYDMKLKVGYYARVSTDKDDQLNSLENQQKYFEEMINENKNWTLVQGYIDEGISGTAVKKRVSFLKMIEDSTKGKIDLILTKEISRFSRNTVDSIKYSEYLLKNGVIVYFLSDNINTLQSDAEFRLTIMSSLAQDEVRKLSQRVKFGINRMIKDGKLIGGNLTGYYKKNGYYEINQSEAPIIEYLFNTYASGNIGLKKIGLELADMGYLNSKGKPYSSTTLAKFLTNPRYKGYYTAKLSEVEDYKTHKIKKIPKDKQIIYKDDRIPKIVSEELWDKANILHEKRKKMKARNVLNTDKHIKNYKYSCKLYCNNCGKVFIRNGGSNRKNNPVWSCKTYRLEGVKSCLSPNIKESFLDKVFITVFNQFLKNKKDYVNEIIKEYENIINIYDNNVDIEKIKTNIKKIENQKDKLLDLSIKGIIDDYEFKKRNDKFNIDINNLESKINIEDKVNKVDKIDKIKLSLIDKLDINKSLVSLVNLLVDKVMVEKINDDRKNIKLKISFDFNTPDIDVYINLDKCSCIDIKQPGVC